ncbi:MAG: inverse autotransporter beta domain-containing protein [Burkholderiales bacterium]
MKQVVGIALVTALLGGGNLRAETAEEKVEALQKRVETLEAQMKKDGGVSPSEASAANWPDESKVSIGGYGEVTYNNFRDHNVKDIADLKRFVLFFGYRFSEGIKFYSELEVEHAFVKNGNAPSQGELEMEQAFLEFRVANPINVRAGLMIIPSGTINEYHEPPVFYGVERNEVESRIIPTTWRELGVAVQGVVADGLEYNAGIVTTPDASLYSSSTGAASGFRGMRTSGSKSVANDFGFYAGLNWRGIPGLLVGGSLYMGDTAQNGNGATAKAQLAGTGARLTLWDVHAKYSVAGFDLKALYAAGGLDDTAAINAAAGIAPGSNKAAPEAFYGWLGEVAYHVWRKGDHDLAPFMRYERYNTQKEVAAGFATDPLNDEKVITLGLNYKPHPQVVIKADYQNYKADNKKDRWNLGIGYMF